MQVIEVAEIFVVITGLMHRPLATGFWLGWNKNSCRNYSGCQLARI
jgi:hypothetical protein